MLSILASIENLVQRGRVREIMQSIAGSERLPLKKSNINAIVYDRAQRALNTSRLPRGLPDRDLAIVMTLPSEEPSEVSGRCPQAGRLSAEAFASRAVFVEMRLRQALSSSVALGVPLHGTRGEHG